jgi:hypothetical protein
MNSWKTGFVPQVFARTAVNKSKKAAKGLLP